MREIEFRGKRIDNGEYIYGDLFTSCRGKRFIWGDNLELEEVEPNSVSQLVGYDANGKKVYEGDTVIREYPEADFEHIARLESMTQNPDTAEFFFFPYPAPFIKIKEAQS